MPRVSELRTNFTAGELSKLVNARTDFGRYYNGSEIVENFLPLPQGPLFRRKGFRFIAETKDSTKKSCLIEFEFSDSQSYAIEVGDGYMRFFKDQARLLENTTTITGATQANPVVITDTAHPYSNGDVIIIQDVVGMTELNGKEFTVANKATNTYELQGIDGTGYTAYSSGGTSSRIHEIASPYLESEIFDVQYVQDSDVVYLVHPNHPVQKLIRVASNSFTIADADLLKGPFVTENVVSTDLVALTAGSWAQGDSGTLTASGGHTPFTSNHIGGLWKVRSGTDIAFLKITAFTSSTIVTVEFQEAIPASLRTGTHFTWSEGEFSDARSHPAAIALHEQRLILSGALFNPRKVFFSQSNADYENFEAGTEDDDAFNVKIASQKGDIKWLFSDEVLFIGTTNGIFRATSSSNGSVLTPSDIDIKRHISFGCSNIPPRLVGSSVLYPQKSNKKIRAINYNINSDKYAAQDLTVDAEHITESGLVQLSYQQDPLSNLWSIRSDGELALLSSEQDQEVLAWYRLKTQGYFESIAVINSSDDTDEIYAVVKRTIGGTTKRYIEVQDPNFLVSNLYRTYVDSFLTYNGTQTITLTLDSSDGIYVLLDESGNVLLDEDGNVLVSEEFATNVEAASSLFTTADVGKEIHDLDGNGRALITAYVDDQNVTLDILEPFDSETLTNWAFAVKTITGLDHLEGSTVSICSDGATIPDQVVSNGAITLSLAGAIVHVGLSYASTVKSMPLEAQSLSQVIGSTQGKLNRIDTASIRFENTNGGKVVSGENTIVIPARSTNNNMNETPSLFDGDKEIRTGGTWGTISQLSVVQDGPQPMTIKSITYKITVNDK